MYDFGLTNAAVILGLTIPPCLAFLLFAVDRKNRIAFFRSLFLPICRQYTRFAMDDLKNTMLVGLIDQ